MKSITIELNPLIRKVPIRLNNINFELNSADLMQSCFPELDRVVRLLKDNPDIYVELSAHTCDIGSDHFNDLLSLKRARSVVNYLTMNKINFKRMVARGYGEKVPLVSNTSEGNRMQNRRVELKILDENDQEFQVEERINE
jgi:outer membrane protein OmpA-like peptidoglycan-associated protein